MATASPIVLVMSWGRECSKKSTISRSIPSRAVRVEVLRSVAEATISSPSRT